MDLFIFVHIVIGVSWTPLTHPYKDGLMAFSSPSPLDQECKRYVLYNDEQNTDPFAHVTSNVEFYEDSTKANELSIIETKTPK